MRRRLRRRSSARSGHRGRRQGGPARAEPQAAHGLAKWIYTDADAHKVEEQWGFGEWHEAGGSWSGWQWDQPGDGLQTRHGGETAALEMEVGNLRGAVFGLQQGQSDVQAGLAAMMGKLRSMAAAVTGLQQAAVSATPVMQSTCEQSPEPLAIQSGLITPRVSSKRVADHSPDHPGFEVPGPATAGTEEGVQQQQG